MLATPRWIWSYSLASAIAAHLLVVGALVRERAPIKTTPRQQVRVATVRLQPKVQEAPRVVARSPKKAKKKPLPKKKPVKKAVKKAARPAIVAVDPAPYREELAERVMLLLRLPEFGAVRLSLTLDRNGNVRKIEVVNEANTKNRDYVIQELKQASFPPFGRFFPKEEEHTFCLTLNNDL